MLLAGVHVLLLVHVLGRQLQRLPLQAADRPQRHDLPGRNRPPQPHPHHHYSVSSWRVRAVAVHFWVLLLLLVLPARRRLAAAAMAQDSLTQERRRRKVKSRSGLIQPLHKFQKLSNCGLFYGHWVNFWVGPTRITRSSL